MSTGLLAAAHVFFETYQGECDSTLGMRQGFLLYSGGFSVGFFTLEFILTFCMPYMIHGTSY